MFGSIDHHEDEGDLCFYGRISRTEVHYFYIFYFYFVNKRYEITYELLKLFLLHHQCNS